VRLGDGRVNQSLHAVANEAPESTEAAAPRRIADARLCRDARGRDGGFRQKLAVGEAPMTNHHEEPAPLPALVWAVVFTILLVAAVATFTLVLIR
jgi:hypothetical protein